MLFTVKNISNKEKQVILRIDEVRKSLNYALGAPQRWYGLLRRSTLAKAIRGSNSIEGLNVSVEDAIAVVDGGEPTNATDEAWRANVGYGKAMTYVLQLADDPHFAYGPGFIRSLHYMMVEYDLMKRPGKWRPGPIYVRDEQKNTIVYEGPNATQIPGLTQELMDLLNVPDDLPVMVRAALGHLNLVMIHPFADGNGRMGRCLQTLILAREGILAPQFCSIEEYLGHHTQEYYAVLSEVGRGSWRPENDTHQWIKFCLTAHYKQAMTLLRRTREMERVWDQLESETKNNGLPERAIAALADAAFGYRVRNSTYRTTVDVSELSASRDLKLLVEAGLLEAQGDKRGRSYIASPYLRAIRDNARESQRVEDPFEGEALLLPF
jgi:Fic family protein